MAKEQRNRDWGLTWSPAVSATSAVVGGLFVLYALSKTYLATAALETGWRFAGLGPEHTALAVHLAESVPMAIFALGLASLAVRTGAAGPLARAGFSLSVVGIGLTIVSHFAEHVLPSLTIPALFGGENLLVWGYYLSWLVLYVGLAVYGIALAATTEAPGWLVRLLVVLLPTVVVVGFATVVLDLFTLAGTFRVALGLAWIRIGHWLWTDRRPIGPLESDDGR